MSHIYSVSIFPKGNLVLDLGLELLYTINPQTLYRNGWIFKFPNKLRSQGIHHNKYNYRFYTMRRPFDNIKFEEVSSFVVFIQYLRKSFGIPVIRWVAFYSRKGFVWLTCQCHLILSPTCLYQGWKLSWKFALLWFDSDSRSSVWNFFRREGNMSS